MFICDECREKNYTNERPLSGSRGPCEICGKVTLCGSHQAILSKKMMKHWK